MQKISSQTKKKEDQGNKEKDKLERNTDKK
jgi:hypothetical protein